MLKLIKVQTTWEMFNWQCLILLPMSWVQTNMVKKSICWLVVTSYTQNLQKTCWSQIKMFFEGKRHRLSPEQISIVYFRNRIISFLQPDSWVAVEMFCRKDFRGGVDLCMQPYPAPSLPSSSWWGSIKCNTIKYVLPLQIGAVTVGHHKTHNLVPSELKEVVKKKSWLPPSRSGLVIFRGEVFEKASLQNIYP